MPISTPVQIELSEEERAQLESWARRRSSAQALAQRCRVVLLASQGLSNTEIGQRLGVHRNTARAWRGRFVAERLDGLVDEPRPGRPRTVSDAKVEEVIAKTLETTPRDATHWSTRSMAAEAGLTQSAVHRIWRAFGLQPHRQEAWKLSKDPLFVAKVRDVVGLYLDPPERAVVLCVDEKSQIQALDRTAPILPIAARDPRLQALGYLKPRRRAGHHDRQGDRVTARPSPPGRVQEVPQTLDREVPSQLDVHLILDNASTHKTPTIKRWLLAHPRFVLHFTPTSSSWLNLVERWLGELTNKKIKRGTHRSVRHLNTDIRAWNETWNENPRPYVWTKTADQILDSISRYCNRINASRH